MTISSWIYCQLPGEVSHSGTLGEIHLTLKCAPCGWMRRFTTISSPLPTLLLENYPLMISKGYRPGFSTFNHLQIVRVATAGVDIQFTVCSNEPAAAKWADSTPFKCTAVFALHQMSLHCKTCHICGVTKLCVCTRNLKNMILITLKRVGSITIYLKVHVIYSYTNGTNPWNVKIYNNNRIPYTYRYLGTT